LTYNPAILTVTGGIGGAGSDATDQTAPAGSFAMVGSPVIANGVATVNFTFHNTKTRSGTVVLGDIVAKDPDTAATTYKTKELLQTSAITVNGGASVKSANSVHINAYFGDLVVTASPVIDSQDALAANKVAIGAASGFDAYQLLDPAIIGDIAGHLSVDATAVSSLFAVVAGLPVAQIPAIPTSVTSVSFTAADPTLSLMVVPQPLTPDPSPLSPGGRGDLPDEPGGVSARSATVNVAVLLDDPHPQGSSGMIAAHLALMYDPTVLSVSA